MGVCWAERFMGFYPYRMVRVELLNVEPEAKVACQAFNWWGTSIDKQVISSLDGQVCFYVPVETRVVQICVQAQGKSYIVPYRLAKTGDTYITYLIAD